MRRRFDARARELGLTRAQWRVLAQLRRREGINQTALAEILEIEPISLGRHIDRLVEKDIVERRPDPRDRRAWRLYLKPEAQPILDRLRTISNANRKEVLRGIPPGESEALIDTLLKIKSNLTALEAAEGSGTKSEDED
ncbi:MAG: MarR family winged helix-turn-helix transcriptional regulator [Hyphomicrobiaceae bacterium]